MWSGHEEQRQVVPWHEISDVASAEAFATEVANAPRPYEGETYIGDALLASMELLNDSPFEGTRKVIDISGDGNQSGFGNPRDIPSIPVERAREIAVAQGYTINGLPIEGKEARIVEYYCERVIIGPGAFCIAIKDPDDIAGVRDAIAKKLAIEIASRE